MHAALDLRRRRAELEAQNTVVGPLAQLRDRLDAHVLERVAEAALQVRLRGVRARSSNDATHDELVQAALLLDEAADTLRDARLGAVADEVPCAALAEAHERIDARSVAALPTSASLFASMASIEPMLRESTVSRERPDEPAVDLKALALGPDDGAGRLSRAGEDGAAHDARSAESERLGDVRDGRDATVGDAGHAKLVGELRDRMHSRRLWPTDRRHLLRTVSGVSGRNDGPG